MTAEPARGTASVIVCAFAQRRWPDLLKAIDSLAVQSRPADELIVVIDHNPQLLERATHRLNGARVVANHHARGLSGARNTGIEAASGDVIAFIDDDAIADPSWLALLLAPYADSQVIAVGGAVVPHWDRGRPRGFPEEFDWVVGCSYRGMPRARRPVRNLIGANMSFRRDVFETVGGFSDGIGRIGSRPVGCEETELCIRAGNAFPGHVILYEPAARVLHRVPPSRASWRYFGARCFSEGLSKALVAHVSGARRGLSSERSYAARTLPSGVAHGVAAAVSGDASGIVRSAAMVGGLSITSLGFVAGSARRAIAIRGPRRDRSDATPTDSWLFLDVHDRVAIRLQRDAPGARQLTEMFAPFRADRLSRCDLTVRGSLQKLDRMVAGEGEHRYRPDALELPGRLQVVCDDDRFQVGGPGELLAPVLALLDALMARRGAAMVHAATVARDGFGVCLAAAGGAGKTSAAVDLVRRRGFAFMGDDWTFISDDGQILGYAKPLFVRPHHRPLFPQLFAEKRKPLAPPGLVHLLGRIATLAHPAISRHARLARIARNWWPEHMIVAPDVALPGVAIERTAPLAAAVFVERAAWDEVTLESRSPDWMASRLVGDFVAGLPRATRELQALLAATGLLSFDALIADKARILRDALAGTRCVLLRVPERMRAEEAAAAIATRVDWLLESRPQAEVVSA